MPFLLMYFSAICLMLYSIWRDPEAEWTGAASDGIKRAAVFGAVGVVLSVSYTLWQSHFSVENDADVNLRAYYVEYITDALKTGGMTLYLHALASNQIPSLMDRATAREEENLGLGVSLFYASAFFVLLPLVLAKLHLVNTESPLSAFMWGLANVAYLPLLLSFSLLSMSYIARREREQRSLLTPP